MNTEQEKEKEKEKEEEKSRGARIGGSLLAKFAKARLKTKGRQENSNTMPADRGRADTSPTQRKGFRHRKSGELVPKDSPSLEADPLVNMPTGANKRASMTFRTQNARKSTWRFSLPEQLHNRVGEDKRVFPAHSLNSTTNNGDPNDLFTLRRKLGDSPHAVVHKATVKETGFEIASKILLMHGQGEAATTSVVQVANEVSLLQRARHPNVVRYYGTFYNDDFMWIIMEYCAIGSIAGMQKYGIRFSELQLASIITSVLHGLAYLHTMGIPHRDLKCSNILMNELGDAKLADFGMPYLWMRTLMKAQGITPSPLWLAPEVYAGETFNQTADIWSLGITVIEMADGQPPYATEEPMRAAYLLANRPSPTVQDPSKWSPAFLDFISQCLQKDPTKRPSARELLRHDFFNDYDSRQSEEVISRLLQQYQKARTKKAALMAENRAQAQPQVSPDMTNADIAPTEEMQKDTKRLSRQLTEGKGKRMSREVLSNIVHYVRNELNIGNQKEKEKEQQQPLPSVVEPEEEPSIIEADCETTYTATDEGHEYDEDTSILSSTDSSSLSSSGELSPTSSPPPAATTILPAQRMLVDDLRLQPSEFCPPYSSSAPAPFLPIRSAWREEYDRAREDNRRATVGLFADEPRSPIDPENDERMLNSMTESGRMRKRPISSRRAGNESLETSYSGLVKVPSGNLSLRADDATPTGYITPNSAKKEVSFATERRENEADKRREVEKALNGLTSVRQTRRSGGGAVGGDGGSYSIFDRNTPEGGEARGAEEEVVYQPQDDRSVMEHYLNLSIINVVNELLSWKSRCQQLEMEMIMEKQKQSQLIQQSQQLLQYLLSSQLPSATLTSPHPPVGGSPVMSTRAGMASTPASPAGYYPTPVPATQGFPPIQLARSTTPTNMATPPQPAVTRAAADRDKRRRSTSSVQQNW